MKLKERKHGLKKGDFHHKKELGQNFIEDKALLEELVNLAEVSLQDEIIEIGPGSGNMTVLLAQKGKKVVAIEVDNRLIPFLQLKESQYPNLKVIHGDVLSLDFQEILSVFQEEKIKVVANIPYYITKEILQLLLQHRKNISSAYLMVQKEVGEKLKAEPTEKPYGPTAILYQYYCEVAILKEIPADFFIPPPKVDSVFIKMKFKNEEDFSPVEKNHEKTFLTLVKGVFQMRRKTLENNIASVFSFSKEEGKEILEKAQIKPKARGEELSIVELLTVAQTIDTFKKNKP